MGVARPDPVGALVPRARSVSFSRGRCHDSCRLGASAALVVPLTRFVTLTAATMEPASPITGWRPPSGPVDRAFEPWREHLPQGLARARLRSRDSVVRLPGDGARVCKVVADDLRQRQTRLWFRR